MTSSLLLGCLLAAAAAAATQAADPGPGDCSLVPGCTSCKATAAAAKASSGHWWFDRGGRRLLGGSDGWSASNWMGGGGSWMGGGRWGGGMMMGGPGRHGGGHSWGGGRGGGSGHGRGGGPAGPSAGSSSGIIMCTACKSPEFVLVAGGAGGGGGGGKMWGGWGSKGRKGCAEDGGQGSTAQAGIPGTCDCAPSFGRAYTNSTTASQPRPRFGCYKCPKGAVPLTPAANLRLVAVQDKTFAVALSSDTKTPSSLPAGPDAVAEYSKMFYKMCVYCPVGSETSDGIKCVPKA